MVQRIQVLSNNDICFWIARLRGLGLLCCSDASEKWCHFHLWGSLCWNPFLLLIGHLEALFTSHHILSFCSQFIASSPWGTWYLEGPETCVNKAEKRWDGVKTTLFCMQENIALSDASSFFHPCCHPGLFHQTFWRWSPGPRRASQMSCVHEREVRGCEDVACWQHPAQGPAHVWSCDSTAMGDHGSPMVLQPGPLAAGWRKQCCLR